MTIVILILSIASVALTTALLIILSSKKDDGLKDSFRTMSCQLEENMNNSMSRMKQELTSSNTGAMETLGKLLSDSKQNFSKIQQKICRS